MERENEQLREAAVELRSLLGDLIGGGTYRQDDIEALYETTAWVESKKQATICTHCDGYGVGNRWHDGEYVCSHCDGTGWQKKCDDDATEVGR